MIVVITFSTGKKIELTEVELQELYGRAQPQQVFINPAYPVIQTPFPWNMPSVTCHAGMQ